MHNNKTQESTLSVQHNRMFGSGVTLVELAVASALMAVVMATVLPIIRCSTSSFDVATSNLEALQSGRVLTDHLHSKLIQARRITSVSPATDTLGYIEFEDNAGDPFRYDVNANGYVDYGPVGSLSKLAGPVSQLQFTCYHPSDLTQSIADVNDIRFIKIQATITNGNALAQDKTVSTSVFLQVCYDPKYRFDMDTGKVPALAQIDTSHYLCAYTGESDDGWAVVLNVAPDLWTLSQGASLEFDTAKGNTPALAQIDTSHYLCAYAGDSNDGFATVLTVDPDDWTIADGAALEFDESAGKTPALAQIAPDQYLCAYEGDNEDGWATILTLDTDTWGLTNTDTFEFDTVQGKTPALAQIDASHYLCAYTGGGDDGWAVVLTTGTDHNLVAHWELNETDGTTASDSSGNGHTGFLTNMSGNEWTAGAVDGALEFGGNDDFIGVLHADDFLIDNGTIALWFKGDDVSNWNALFSKDGSNYITGGHVTIYVESSQNLGVRLQSTTQSYYVSSGETLEDDTWYHMALSWGSAGMKLYLDGSEVDSYAYTGGLGTTSGGIGNYEPLALGANTWGSGHLTITPLQDYFDGTLDDVRIYNKALDADEIAALASGNPNSPMVREFTEARLGTDGTSLTIETPSETSQGDLLIATVATDGDTASSMASPAGKGWTKITTSDTGGDVTQGVWAKLADPSESSSHTFTWSGAEQAYGTIIRITNHNPSEPIVAWATYGIDNSSNPTSPAVTPAVDNTLILRLGAFDDSDISVDSPGLTGHTTITMDTSAPNFGMVAHWKLDESSGTTAVDSSGNGHDGTLSGMVGDEWTSGNLNGALEFRGSDDVVSCGNFDVTGGDGHITLCAWMKADSFDTYDARFISKTTSTAEQSHYWMLSTYGGTRLRFRLRTSGSTTTLYSNSGVLSTGVWTHVAATWDGSTMRIFRNGIEVKNTSKTGTLSTSGSVGVAIGNNPPGAGEMPFDGLIDDVRIYNRALSATELGEAAAGIGGTPLGGTVSGGAGYVVQAASGSSGTCAFSLTAEEQALMVTLAIAPVPEGSSISGNQTLSGQTPFEFDPVKGVTPALIQIDSTHYLCAYEGDQEDGYAVVLSVDTGNWTISRGTPFEFDAKQGKTPALTQIDASHYLCAYEGDGGEGWATVLNVNTGTWTISQGNILPFDRDGAKTPALIRIDNDHHLCAFEGQEGAGTAEVIDPTGSGLEQ